MSERRAAIAISPTPECLCLAAGLRGSWDVLYPAGNRLIADVLRGWAESGDVASGIVIVPEVSEPAAVWDALERLGERNIDVLWAAPSLSAEVAAACRGVKGVRLVTGNTLRDACEAAFGRTAAADGLLRQVDGRNMDLVDFLQYKISMMLMESFSAAPLVSAVEALAGFKGGEFSLASVSPEDARSVENFRENDFPLFEGKSEPMRKLKERIIQVGPTDMGALICGETGSGKEAAAFYIHEFSRRRGGPFVCLNCAGLDETFLRSELFGHEKGAFTGAIAPKKGLVEAAEGGTLFLDELGDMPLEVQADLLRFLQTKRYRSLGGLKPNKADIRVVAAAQPSLFDRMESGEFRRDLFFRIAEVSLHAPALRDAPDDIIRLVRHIAFLNADRAQSQSNKPGYSGFTKQNHVIPKQGAAISQASLYNGELNGQQLDEAGAAKAAQEAIRYFEGGMDVMLSHPWPGNVRELSAAVRRRMFLGDDVLEELRACARAGGNPGIDFSSALPIRSGDDIMQLDDLVRGYVRHAQANCAGLTQRELAGKLGKSLNTIKKILSEEGPRRL